MTDWRSMLDEETGELHDNRAVLPGYHPPPPSPQPGVWPRRRIVALGLIAAGLFGLAVVGWNTFNDQQLASTLVTPSEPLLLPAAADSARPTPTVSAPAAPAELVVYVSGAVHAPDVYRLAIGARVIDALAAAGGPTDEADLESLNLARPLVDAEQIRVARISAAPAEAADATAAPAAVTGRISLNRADATALQQLPGIGPALAERIVAYRTQHGPYSDLNALDAVSGVGPALLNQLAAHVSFEP